MGIVGQEQPINFLLNSYKQQKISHAYLFLGPKGVGKSLTAKFFAQLLNCENIKNTPCFECTSCQKIENNNHPDIFWIKPEENSLGIKISAIRELQERISLKPYEANFKVFIIEEADFLLEDAANCLLKTLEEPPGDAILILIAEKRGKILPTVLSRCQIIKFQSLKWKDLEEFLIARHGLKRDKAEFLSRICEGSLGRAISYLRSDYLDKRNSVLDEFFKRMELEDAVWANRNILLDSIDILLSMFRDSLFIRLGLDDLLVNIDQQETISKFASLYSSEELHNLIEKLNSYYNWLASNANARLVLINLEMDLNRETTRNFTHHTAWRAGAEPRITCIA